MKTVIRQTKTGRYYKQDGRWTGDFREARGFHGSHEAVKHCNNTRLEGVEVILQRGKVPSRHDASLAVIV